MERARVAAKRTVTLQRAPETRCHPGAHTKKGAGARAGGSDEDRGGGLTSAQAPLGPNPARLPTRALRIPGGDPKSEGCAPCLLSTARAPGGLQIWGRGPSGAFCQWGELGGLAFMCMLKSNFLSPYQKTRIGHTKNHSDHHESILDAICSRVSDITPYLTPGAGSIPPKQPPLRFAPSASSYELKGRGGALPSFHFPRSATDARPPSIPLPKCFSTPQPCLLPLGPSCFGGNVLGKRSFSPLSSTPFRAEAFVPALVLVGEM